MKKMPARALLQLPAIVGLLLILPFAILEFAFNILNTPGALTPKNLTSLAVLFGVLWLLPTGFLAVLMPIVRKSHAGNKRRANPALLLLRVVVLVFIAWAWAAMVIDQMPCFLGVPNCD